jgi:NAD(P)-dependent dehydrogenase (short-subunit alcohol dehydrogenase family)
MTKPSNAGTIIHPRRHGLHGRHQDGYCWRRRRFRGVDLAEIANVPVTPLLRDRNGIAQLRRIDSDESPDMLVHDSPSLFEALPANPPSERRYMMPSSSQHSGRSVAVTGAGGGLGRDIALGLAAKGYIVFGTAMSAGEVQDLKDASGGRVSLTICDMTKEEAVKAWAGGVSDGLGDSGLDILINNAGILTPGPIEVLALDAIRREFDVNVFGALSVINAFLPALRKARGRIVQVSTWTASVPLPFNGPSGASKAAMEVFAAVYRAELKPFGIDVVVAAAGNMRTGGPAKTAAALARVADDMTAEQRELYEQSFDTFATTLNGMQSSGLDSVSAATRVIELAEQVPAPSRAPVGADADEMLRAAREKSDAELDAFRLQVVGLS